VSEGINRVVLLGNLGADPELRFTQAGRAVMNMRLAVTESYLDKDKVRRDRTDWINVVVWGARAEGLAKFVKKGFGMLIEGSLQTSSYDDKDGNKVYKTEVVASNVVVTRGDQNGQRSGQAQHRETRADDRQGSRGGYGAPRQQQTPQPANDAPPDDFGYDDGGDAPF